MRPAIHPKPESGFRVAGTVQEMKDPRLTRKEQVRFRSHAASYLISETLHGKPFNPDPLIRNQKIETRKPKPGSGFRVALAVQEIKDPKLTRNGHFVLLKLQPSTRHPKPKTLNHNPQTMHP